jgi:hypothetical protein
MTDPLEPDTRSIDNPPSGPTIGPPGTGPVNCDVPAEPAPKPIPRQRKRSKRP